MNASTITKGSLGAAGLTAAMLLAGLATTGGTPQSATADVVAQGQSSLPATIQLTGVVRDFKARNASGGHPDFQRQPTSGFAHYSYQVADTLDADGKPLFSSTGFKVNTQWRDAQGRNIMPPRPHVGARPGDVNGSRATSTGGALTTADNFRNWFRNTDGVNLSRPLSLTLRKQSNSSVYVFDDRNDQPSPRSAGSSLSMASSGATPASPTLIRTSTSPTSSTPPSSTATARARSSPSPVTTTCGSSSMASA